MGHFIRLATPQDAEALLGIYAPYVKDTAVSFEAVVPTPEAFAARIKAISAIYPYLVCVADGVIAGYAYAAEHRQRVAYCYDVDVSIYLATPYHGSGMAKQLYDGLFALLKCLGYYNAYAAYTAPNPKSQAFHEKYGFQTIGTHHHTGYKFDRWHDVVWLEKAITDHHVPPKGLIPISRTPKAQLQALLAPHDGC